MAPKQIVELTEKQIKAFMGRAQKIVDDNFDPKVHLHP
jgi:hypothetical protein